MTYRATNPRTATSSQWERGRSMLMAASSLLRVLKADESSTPSSTWIRSQLWSIETQWRKEGLRLILAGTRRRPASRKSGRGTIKRPSRGTASSRPAAKTVSSTPPLKTNSTPQSGYVAPVRFIEVARWTQRQPGQGSTLSVGKPSPSCDVCKRP